MKDKIAGLFQRNKGIMQLTPTWVARPFNEPGKRLRLHPDDYYSYGIQKGGICERWLGSVTMALNGPDTKPEEGMSHVLCDKGSGESILFAEVVKVLGEKLIGKELYENYGTWPTFAKLFDYEKPLFHHLHLTEEKAREIGRHGKPESYYFPKQYNAYMGRFPLTYFGFDSSVSKEEVMDCIKNYENFDTRITELSRAYRVRLGTGWYTPAGVIHAPASVVTYEPQWNSDVNIIMENITMGEINPLHLLTDCIPEEDRNNPEKIFAAIDWEESVRKDYKEKYFRQPLEKKSSQNGLHEYWVAYGNEWIAAKEITVAVNTEVILKDSTCYCALVVQGHGTFGGLECEAPGMLRFGQLSADEFFISQEAARKGVVIQNKSSYEPLVILQNFADNNKEVPCSI